MVVCAVDPRRLPALAAYVRRTMPAIPPGVGHVGLEGDVRDLPHEVVLHGDPMLVVRTGGRAPAGHHAWTVQRAAAATRTPLAALARHGLDVREQVVDPGRPLPARAGRAVGRLAARRAVAGARHGPAAARAGHAGRRACTPRARTRRRARACRTSVCPPRWSPRWSGRRV